MALTSAHVIISHNAEVYISIEHGAEFWCRSPKLGAEVESVVPKLLDCPDDVNYKWFENPFLVHRRPFELDQK